MAEVDGDINHSIEKLCIGNDIEYKIPHIDYFINMKIFYPNIKELIIKKLSFQVKYFNLQM